MSEEANYQKLEISTFLQKFKGKAYKVPKEGLSALLLKGSIQNIQAELMDLKRLPALLPSIRPITRSKSKLEPLPLSFSQLSNTPRKQTRGRQDSLPGELKRSPSQKLPALNLPRQFSYSQALPRQASVDATSSKKLSSPELSYSQGKSKIRGKYSQQKYLLDLNEKELRFFQFGENQKPLGSIRKSTVE